MSEQRVDGKSEESVRRSSGRRLGYLDPKFTGVQMRISLAREREREEREAKDRPFVACVLN